MANWSHSWLHIQGDESSIKKGVDFFNKMKDKERETNLGQIPEFVPEKETDGYFHNISTEDYGLIVFDCQWFPPINTLVKIGRHLQVDFTLDYSELGNLVFGKSIYNHKEDKLLTYSLNRKDFDKYSIDKKTGKVIYQGEEHESEEDVLMDIFEKKHGIAY